MYQFSFRLIISTVVALAMLTVNVEAQIHITPHDTVICNGQSVTLHASNNSGSPVNTALTVDDVYSAAIPLGFSFTFYGNTYSQCWVSSNGYITFDPKITGSRSEYNPNVRGPVPGNTDVLNSIMGPWMDIDPSVAGSGTIDYIYSGTAPNRRFIVNYCDIPQYLQVCNVLKSSYQIVLFEGTNNIEMHIGAKPVCLSWPTPAASGGAAIEGLQDATGTIAHLVPGRGDGYVPWTAYRSSHRFVPTSATNYSIAPIPYAPYATTGTGAIAWLNSAGTLLGVGNTLTINPSTSTTYYVRQIYCADTTIDSSRVFTGTAVLDSVQIHEPSYCGSSDGSLILFGLARNQNYEVNYTKNGVPQPQALYGSSATGTITINNLTAGIYNNIRVNIPGCLPGPGRGPYTLTNPHIPVSFIPTIHYACNGNDTVVLRNTTSIPGTINYTWDFGDNTSSSIKDPIHVYTTQNSYTIKLIADNGICRDSTTQNINTRHVLDAFFLVDNVNPCVYQTIQFKDSSLIPSGNGLQPTYTWDFGDNTSGTGITPGHAYQNTGTYTVRLIVTDFIPCADTFYRTIIVKGTPTVSFVMDPSTICEGQRINFNAVFNMEVPGGYVWSFGDSTRIHNTNPVSHAYDSSGTYEVVLTTHYKFCRDTNYKAFVTVYPFPGINLGRDTFICPQGAPFTLRNLSDHGNYPGASYLWTTGATTPAITVNTDGTYGATINYNGCTAADSITVFKDCYLDVPNSFTPNGDGLNDYFLPRQLLSHGLTAYKMTIFNRWGEVIFETTNLDGRGWDGRFNDVPQPQGVFIYLIDAAFTNGVKEHYTGNVTLLR